ncbi:MAG: FAD-dependent oxidoreductase, partial [Kineosporiaceae bacterium]
EREEWLREWGVDETVSVPGGLLPPRVPAPGRAVYLLQRRTGRVGAGLGRTTGWVHRAALRARGVEFVSGVTYTGIDADGLHLTVAGRPRLIEADDVVLCAGQVPNRDLSEELAAAGVRAHLIGGAREAGELDAKRAIEEGTRLGLTL